MVFDLRFSPVCLDAFAIQNIHYFLSTFAGESHIENSLHNRRKLFINDQNVLGGGADTDLLDFVPNGWRAAVVVSLAAFVDATFDPTQKSNRQTKRNLQHGMALLSSLEKSPFVKEGACSVSGVYP